jgi:hypothetical protein
MLGVGPRVIHNGPPAAEWFLCYRAELPSLAAVQMDHYVTPMT